MRAQRTPSLAAAARREQLRLSPIYDCVGGRAARAGVLAIAGGLVSFEEETHRCTAGVTTFHTCNRVASLARSG